MDRQGIGHDSRFIDEVAAYNEMKTLLEQRLGRELTEKERSTINWLADCEYQTIGVIVDLFDELSKI